MFLLIFRERHIDIREKHRSVASCTRPLWGSNPWPFGVWDNTPSNWATWPGPARAFLIIFKYFNLFLEKGGEETSTFLHFIFRHIVLNLKPKDTIEKEVHPRLSSLVQSLFFLCVPSPLCLRGNLHHKASSCMCSHLFPEFLFYILGLIIYQYFFKS